MGLFLLVFKFSENFRANVLAIFVYSLLTGAREQSPVFLEQCKRSQLDCANYVFFGTEKKPPFADL